MTYEKVWRHITNKALFATQPYPWQDRILIIDETRSREVVCDTKVSSFDFTNWTQCSIEELNRVKSKYKDMGGGV